MLTLAPKATLPSKVALKWKSTGKDDHPTKKATGQPTGVNREDKSQKFPSPPIMGSARALCQPMVPSSLALSSNW